MRHLELPSSPQDFDCDVKSDCSIEIKDEDLEALDIKEDFMELPLDVTLESDSEMHSVTKTELCSDEDDSFDETDLIGSSEKHSSNSNSPETSPVSKDMKTRSRRKNLQPQRLQSESSSSVSQSEANFIMNDNYKEPEEGEDDVRDIEADIFKGLKDETGEELDEEMQRSVKEEWKSHWGVKCNMCERMFTVKSEFDKHYRNTYSAKPVYTCSYCDKTMDKYSTFRSHCYRHITDGRYKCFQCGKGFSLESMLQDHMLAKHTEVKPFICEECGKGFVTKPGLKIHLKKHKTGEKEDYPCVECGKVLHTRGGLTAHMNVHRLGRRFMCDMCGKTFTQKVNMQQHVKHHNGERPFTCDKCGKSFAEKSHLARHYSFHSEKRPFKCEVCQKMYKTERCLKVHSMVHASSRPYVCTYCNKGFLSSTKLKQHLNIHTGQRPFKCKYCERTFTNYPNWLKHTRRRHKVDHKTGLDLVPKQEVMTPAPQPEQEPSAPDLANFMLDYATLSGRVTDGPAAVVASTALNTVQIADDRLTLQQQHIDFITGMTGPHPVDLVVPCYTQDPLQLPDHYLNHAANLLDVPQQIVPQHYSDQLLHPQLMQQHMLQM